jgi:hypothetical protein
MARKLSGGLVGQPSVGAINVAPTAIFATADNQEIGFANNVSLNSQNDLRFADADSSNYVAFQAPSTISTNYTLTLPAAVSGSNGFALTSDTSGNLSWSAAGAALTDNTSDSGTNYITFTTSTSGLLTAARVSSTKMTFQPSTGTFTVTNIVESSSIALKENIVPINDALNSLMELSGVTYDRRDGSTKGEAGLIAEEVIKILPNLVTKNHRGEIEGIQYTKLTAYLIEAVKSLKLEIDSLKGR